MLAGPNVQERWEQLYRRWLLEDKKISAYQPSGSSSSTPRLWSLYDSMQFLKTCCKSSHDIVDTFDSNRTTPEWSEFAKKNWRKKSALDTTIESFGTIATQALQALTKPSAPTQTSIPTVSAQPQFSIKMQLINEEYEKMPDDKKKLCFNDFMEVLKKYI